MKNLYILILICAIMACNRNKLDCCGIVDTSIRIQYKDTLNRDLLDQSNPYAYNFGSMKHFYMEDSIVHEVNNYNADHPKQLNLYLGSDSTYTLKIDPYVYSKGYGDIIFTDIIQLDDNDMDTIMSEIEISTTVLITKKIWYNGILKYDSNVDEDKFFIITK
ncbi:MAG: hypothetical protein R2801_01470 [Chitinophagales bacterium]